MKKTIIILSFFCFTSLLWGIEPSRVVDLYTSAPAESNGFTPEDEIVRICRENIRREERSKDWAKYYRYEQQNDSLIANHIPVKAVFMGNSITDNWGKWRPEFFAKYHCAARGISGQTSYQMLVRFQSDVIDLHPEKVFLLIGTNDVACNNGPISDKHFMAN